jgi:O-antigen ligase
LKFPFIPPAGTEPFARLHQANLLLLGLMPAALLLARGGAEVVMAVIGLSFLWVTIAGRKWSNLAGGTVAVLLATWLVLNLVISPQAMDPAQSFARSLVWIRFIMFFAAISTWLVRSPRDLRILLAMWSVTLALGMLDGFVQYVSGVSLSGREAITNRLTGPLDRPNIGMLTARIGFPLLAMALFLLNGDRASLRRISAIVAFSLVAFAFIILSGERTAAILTMLSIVFGAVLVIFLVRPLRIYGLLMTLAVPAAFLLLYRLSDAVRDRVAAFWTDIDHFWASPYGGIFRVAFEIWQHFPLAGSGMKGYQDACEILGLARPLHPCFQHAHNIYLEWLSETGLVGLSCLLVFIAFLVWPVLRLTWLRPDRRLTGAALCGGLIVTLFPLAATQSFFSNWPAMLMWTAFGVIAGVTRLAQQARPDTPG